MRNDITIRFSGEQGSGVQLTGQLVASYFTTLGYSVFAINEFESRIRGGYSRCQLRISNDEIGSVKKIPDICFPLSASSVEHDLLSLSQDTCLFLLKGFTEVSTASHKVYTIDDTFLRQNKLLPYLNTFFVSLLVALFKTDKETLKDIIREKLHHKKDEILNKNFEVLSLGAAAANQIELAPFPLLTRVAKEGEKTISGAHSIALGTAMSNCRFYAAYPMSPSTSLLTHLSGWSQESPLLTEQAEDEISAINLALGASFAGVRSMVGTSGGGLALMSETVSLSAIAEIPIVIMNAQRPGPATGLPTRTEQGDLLFTLFIGHGEFSRIILAPGTHARGFELTQKAFWLADKYQVPVFILTDQLFMDSMKTCEKPAQIEQYQERFIDVDCDTEEEYLRYRFTENGVSPRKIPGLSKHPVIADSHTHDESGYITENSELRKKGVEKLVQKKSFILNDIAPPFLSTSIEEADGIVIGWGSTFGVIQDAVKALIEKGYSLCHIHYDEIYPLHTEYLVRQRTSRQKLICIENNASAQFAALLKMEAGIFVDESILKYDGRPFYLDELIGLLKEKL